MCAPIRMWYNTITFGTEIMDGQVQEKKIQQLKMAAQIALTAVIIMRLSGIELHAEIARVIQKLVGSPGSKSSLIKYSTLTTLTTCEPLNLQQSIKLNSFNIHSNANP